MEQHSQIDFEQFKAQNKLPKGRNEHKSLKEPRLSEAKYIDADTPREQREVVPHAFTDRIKYYLSKGLSNLEVARKMNC